MRGYLKLLIAIYGIMFLNISFSLKEIYSINENDVITNFQRKSCAMFFMFAFKCDSFPVLN